MEMQLNGNYRALGDGNGRGRSITRRRKAATLLAAAVALPSGFFVSAQHAFAATDTWVGSVSANWGDANWSGTNNPPLNGDALVFNLLSPASGLTLSDNLMTPASFTVPGITFASTAGAYVINPATAGTNGFTLTTGITNSSTSLQTINDLITISGTGTFTTTAGGGNIELGGAISGGTLNVAGTGTLILAAAPGTVSSLANSYMGNNAGSTTKFLSGIYTFAAPATSNANQPGTLDVAGGTVVFSNGRAFASAGATVNLSAGEFTVGTTTADRFDNTSLGAGKTFTMNISGGLFDIPSTQYGLYLGSQGSAGTAGTAITPSTVAYNQNSGTAQIGVTTGLSASQRSLNIGCGAATNYFVATYNLSAGALRAGVIQGGAVGTGSSNNFNFTGGTLTTGSYVAANLTDNDGVSPAATGTLFASGTIAPGFTSITSVTPTGATASPAATLYTGRTAITGNLQFDTGSALAIGIGGTTAATGFLFTKADYDNVSVTGSATLGGSLSLSLINSFVPSAGNAFTILTDGTGINVAGSFTNVANGGLISSADDKALFQATYGSNNSVVLTTIAGNGSNIWNANGGGSWGVAGNWSTNHVPSGAGDNAVFGTALTSNGTVTLDQAYTVGVMTFADAAASYTISGGTGPFTLTLNNSAADSTITDAVGSHTISAPIAIGGNNTLDVSVSRSGDTLTLSGGITGATSGTGTLTDSGAGQLVTGAVTSINQITHNAAAGKLTLGTVTGIGTLSDLSTTGSSTPTIINQSGTGLTVGTIKGVSGSVVDFAGDTTGDTTVAATLGTGGQLIQVSNGSLTLGSGRHTLANLEVDGGTLTANAASNRLGLDGTAAGQTLTVTGGLVSINGTSYGLRLNGDNGPTVTGTNNTSVTINQSGGSINFQGGGLNYLQMGSTSTGDTTRYNLSGGTLSNTVSSGAITLGADTGGSSQTTFNMTGGTLVSYSGIAGSQGTGANQAFVWTGGTLSVGTFDATNLTSTVGTAVSASTNTLNNGGGTLAVGGINGLTGKTILTGNYAGGGGTSALAFSLGGTTTPGSFQQGGSTFDLLAVSGTVAINDNLYVTVVNGLNPAGASFKIITANTTGTNISGTFANLTGSGNVNGTTTDGGYTYSVAYNDTQATGDDIVLSNFQAVPEPTSLSLFTLGGLALMHRRRRTRAMARNSA
jgi:fibronectin-binding autotransporter adhesin